jgi:hypothetical protein
MGVGVLLLHTDTQPGARRRRRCVDHRPTVLDDDGNTLVIGCPNCPTRRAYRVADIVSGARVRALT